MYARIDFNQLELATPHDVSLPKIAFACGRVESRFDGSIVPMRRVRCRLVAAFDDSNSSQLVEHLGRIAPGDEDLFVVCGTLGSGHNTSRLMLRNGADDRLQGDSFIQLFLFQRAMMNSKATQLAI